MRLDELLQRGPSAFLFGILAVLLGASLALWVSKWFARRARVRRAARAGLAERKAARVLVAAGYSIVGYQVRRDWSLWADAREVRFGLVADYLVEHEGEQWIAEVKTGERALDLRYGPTRRQLLEYRHAFGVAGVLLVDAEAERVQRVRFREATRARGLRSGGRLFWLAIGVLLGLLLAHYAARAWPR